MGTDNGAGASEPRDDAAAVTPTAATAPPRPSAKASVTADPAPAPKLGGTVVVYSSSSEEEGLNDSYDELEDEDYVGKHGAGYGEDLAGADADADAGVGADTGVGGAGGADEAAEDEGPAPLCNIDMVVLVVLLNACLVCYHQLFLAHLWVRETLVVGVFQSFAITNPTGTAPTDEEQFLLLGAIYAPLGFILTYIVTELDVAELVSRGSRRKGDRAARWEHKTPSLLSVLWIPFALGAIAVFHAQIYTLHQRVTTATTSAFHDATGARIANEEQEFLLQAAVYGPALVVVSCVLNAFVL